MIVAELLEWLKDKKPTDSVIFDGGANRYVIDGNRLQAVPTHTWDMAAAKRLSHNGRAAQD